MKETPIVNGLKQVVYRKKTPGYDIFNYICKKCGSEISFKREDIVSRCNCGGEYKYKDMIDAKAVEKIVSRKVKYICPVCEKVYDYPADCCVIKRQHIKEIVSNYNFPDRFTRSIYGQEQIRIS